MEPRNGRIIVGLLWYTLRSTNMGWGAMTISQLVMLKQAAEEAGRDFSVRIIGPDGPLRYPPADVHLEEVIINSRRDVVPGSAVARAISECDVILSGPGDLFSDFYGIGVFGLITSPKLLALGQRKPLILSPQTIGPFKSPRVRSIAAGVMRRCEKVFARDAQSFALARELGVTSECAEETADLAFRLPFERPLRDRSSGIRVGLNVSGLVYAMAVARKLPHDFKADYPSLIHGLIASLVRRQDISVVLVPHVVSGPGLPDDDLRVTEKLAKQYSLPMAPKFASPIEAKSFISGLDLLVGSRMHATIAALSSGVPVAPLAYSSKFRGVYNSVDYPLIRELASDDTESLIASVHMAIDRLPELRAAAEKSNAVAQSKLDRYQAQLVEMIRSIH